MARPHPLKVLMNEPLPSKTQQKRNCYRPTLSEVRKVYNLINKYVFNGRLTRPKIILTRCHSYWGLCFGNYRQMRPGTYCRIILRNSYPSGQMMVQIIAHEMVHQYQWDIYSTRRLMEGKEAIMSHGPSFFAWRDKLAEYDIDLSVSM